jgi:hypothetical protein
MAATFVLNVELMDSVRRMVVHVVANGPEGSLWV